MAAEKSNPNKTVIIYIDKYITRKLDEVLEKYVNHPRGRVISIALSIFYMQSKEKRNEYIQKAYGLIDRTSELDVGNEYGTIRKGKDRINLYVRKNLADKLKNKNKKLIVLASLIFVGLIKE